MYLAGSLAAVSLCRDCDPSWGVAAALAFLRDCRHRSSARGHVVCAECVRGAQGVLQLAIDTADRREGRDPVDWGGKNDRL